MRAWVRREVPLALEVLGLCGLVVTQPVLETFQKGADVFVLRRAGPFEIVAFALGVALVPAFVLWAVGALVGIAGETSRRVAHAVTLGGLGGLLAVELAKDLTSFGPRRLVPIAVLVALAVGLAVWRWRGARLLARYVAAGAVLFVGIFLFVSPVAPLVFSGRVQPVDATVHDPAPVVMIVLDELPLVSLLDGHGQIDAGRFPALAGLAADATWYRNHSTVAPITPSAVPAILTGRLPKAVGTIPVASSYPDNLFTLLGGTYDVRAAETLTHLCPASVCGATTGAATPTVLRSLFGTAGGLWRETVSPSADGASGQFAVSDLPIDPDAPDRLTTFAAGLAASGDRPRFDYVHVLLPHQPWDFLPSGARYDAPDPPTGEPYLSVWADQHAADVARQRHVLQLELADRLVGQVIDRLKALGTYDDSLVVVTADHGVAFTRDTPIRGIDNANYPEIMWTPFFVKAPGQRSGVVSDEPLQSIDDLPTIASLLDVEVPWTLDGAAAGSGDGAQDPGTKDERVMLDWQFHGIHPTEGDYLTFDGVAGFADVLAHAPVGDPGGGLGVYRVGRDAALIGRRVDDLTVGDPMPATAGVTTAGAYVAGAVALDPPGRLALVVDGVVVATPTLYREAPGDSQFFAMVPPRWRTADPSAVAIFAIKGEPGSAVLHPLGG